MGCFSQYFINFLQKLLLLPHIGNILEFVIRLISFTQWVKEMTATPDSMLKS